MKRKDCISGLFFLVISIVICFHAFQLNIGTLTNPKPGFFPFFSGAILGVVSIEILLRSLLIGENFGRRNFWKEIKWKKVSYVLGALVGYPLVINFFGFVASTFLFFISLFWVVERMPWWKALLGSACGSVVSYLFFVRWLQCQLPTGIIGY